MEWSTFWTYLGQATLAGVVLAAVLSMAVVMVGTAVLETFFPEWEDDRSSTTTLYSGSRDQ